MDNFLKFLLLFMISFTSFMIGVLLTVGSYKTEFKITEQHNLLSECEKALPRNQKCVIVLSTRIENVEEK